MSGSLYSNYIVSTEISTNASHRIKKDRIKKDRIDLFQSFPIFFDLSIFFKKIESPTQESVAAPGPPPPPPRHCPYRLKPFPTQTQRVGLSATAKAQGGRSYHGPGNYQKFIDGHIMEWYTVIKAEPFNNAKTWLAPPPRSKKIKKH